MILCQTTSLKPPSSTQATKSCSIEPLRSADSSSNRLLTKSRVDRPCPLSRDSLLYLRRRSNALHCSLTSGYPENDSSSNGVTAAASSDLHSTNQSSRHPSVERSTNQSLSTPGQIYSDQTVPDAVNSSFDAAPSSTSNSVQIFYDAAAEAVFSSSLDSDSSRLSIQRLRRPTASIRATESASDSASPSHVCAAFSGKGGAVTSSFGVEFSCVICGKKAPRKEAGEGGVVPKEDGVVGVGEKVRIDSEASRLFRRLRRLQPNL